jgi:peptidoglycan/LPS O-acetylase OafA/YrhL
MTEQNKLDFVDGYRGYLAGLVYLDHLFWTYGPGTPTYGEYEVIKGTGPRIAVPGFFVLSAFLLTHRLLVDLEKAQNNQSYLLVVSKYFIRRFFRIYLVFAIFWTLVHLDMRYGVNIIGGYINNRYTDYWSGLKLLSTGSGHLWTIPCEIRYYFFIPIICLAVVKSKRYWLVLWTLTTAWIVYNQKYNPLGFTGVDYDHWFGYKLWARFDIFLTGSQSAILYYHIERTPIMMKILNNAISRKAFNVILTVLFIYQFRGVIHSQFMGGLYETIMLATMLFSEKTGPISAFFNSSFMMSCGKYSFGIYLFHPMVIEIFIRLRRSHGVKFTYQFEFVITIFVFTYFVGLVWFHLLENTLIKFANKVCKKAENYRFFQAKQTIGA